MGQATRAFQGWLRGVVGACVLSACGAAPGEDGTVLEAPRVPPGEVAVELSVPRRSLGAQDEVALQLTFTNVSTHPVRLLRWYVPDAEGVKEGLFDVSRDGEPVAYLGPHAKRAVPEASDYLVLAPGERLTGRAPLSDLYDLSASGEYTVRFAAPVEGPHGVALTRVAQLDGAAVSLWIEGRPTRPPDTHTRDTVTAQGLGYIGCSSTRQAQVQSAWAAARGYASNAMAYLNGLRAGSERYGTWFGGYSTSHRDVARGHFSRISSALNTAPIVMDCTCTDAGTFAYVYPSAPYRIYLCGAFWRAATTGTDSRAGTLIHELSHFNVVADTNDHAYGQGNAQSLARSSATRALDNADSHEYFAENTPPRD
ncbi:M35 family metallo-endopeptidase [Archangium primigenium]|uniref:M35 family metallo-endopeptidase n=1 Tax=[Archangium] primigenium TaxID=2792470 RepID=UPI00195A5DF9|nr:M35 family metallo-endopeptidase [Archangium primigenium]MBM7116710.1 peptidase M35 [Archangium primigenium]